MALRPNLVTVNTPHSPLVARRRESVLDAAERLLAAEGADVTMTELAAAADVGRRTLFRYFESRESLIAEAIDRSYTRLMRDVFAAHATDTSGPSDLIREVLTATHLVASNMGRAHWQIASDPESHPGLAQASERRRSARTRYVTEFCEQLWDTAGLSGSPPPWLYDAFGLVESLFAYEALRRDFGRSDGEIIESAVQLMQAAFDRAAGSAGSTT